MLRLIRGLPRFYSVGKFPQEQLESYEYICDRAGVGIGNMLPGRNVLTLNSMKKSWETDRGGLDSNQRSTFQGITDAEMKHDSQFH